MRLAACWLQDGSAPAPAELAVPVSDSGQPSGQPSGQASGQPSGQAPAARLAVAGAPVGPVAARGTDPAPPGPGSQS